MPAIAHEGSTFDVSLDVPTRTYVPPAGDGYVSSIVALHAREGMPQLA
jgi:hypothetical protein